MIGPIQTLLSEKWNYSMKNSSNKTKKFFSYYKSLTQTIIICQHNFCHFLDDRDKLIADLLTLKWWLSCTYTSELQQSFSKILEEPVGKRNCNGSGILKYNWDNRNSKSHTEIFYSEILANEHHHNSPDISEITLK